jgi:hypothetical protein
MFDFNTAETQRMREVIPADTVAPIQINFRPGDAGEGKWLKSSKDGTSRGLDCEFTVVAGEHAKRKFWSRLTVEGETDGQKTAADITRVTLRAILESARGIRPDDQSDDAKKARMAEYADFDGIRFIAASVWRRRRMATPLRIRSSKSSPPSARTGGPSSR